ncbi:Uncharacterised protein [Campylobacter concisus]|nr:Uncharacterised protein [Campylobacter concisus]
MGSNSKMVRYKLNGEEAIKVFYDNKELDAIELIPYNPNSIFKVKTIKKNSDEINNLEMVKAIRINKVHLNNIAARLRMVRRGE